MQTRERHIKEVFLRLLKKFAQPRADHLLEEVAAVTAPAADAITQTFYGELLQLEESSYFLSQSLVSERLSISLSAWVCGLVPAISGQELEAFITQQIRIGNIHARINVPMYLVNYGGRVIKREITRCLMRDPHLALDAARLMEGIILVDEIIDTSISLINEGYFSDLLEYEQSTQAMRSEAISNNMAALELERLRSSLFDWLRNVLTALHESRAQDRQVLSIRRSEFGRWMLYKADIIFGESKELTELEARSRSIEIILERLLDAQHRNKVELAASGIKALNDEISKASWLLSNLSSKLMSQESSKDPLTLLFNRRFLAPILQKSTKNSITYGLIYALILVDVDHFKRCNDSYGHKAGDEALQQVARQISQSVRSAGDYVFRYGGEEFLVLINDVTEVQAINIAENIRKQVQLTDFETQGGKPFRMTVSCGLALHTGHPDYNLTLTQADQALYQAKQDGRNSTRIYQGQGSTGRVTAGSLESAISGIPGLAD